MRVSGYGLAAAVIAVCGVACVTPAHALTDGEAKCSSSLAKSFAKLQNTILKTKAACHADDISGDTPVANCDVLPAELEEKITKAKAKFVSSVSKACSGDCSSGNTCVTSLNCPAQHLASPAHNSNAEFCDFELATLDWPGPYCESILGHRMNQLTDVGECVVALVDKIANPIHENLYADLDETSGLTQSAQDCIAAIDKAMQKTLMKAFTKTAACRDARRHGNDPETAWSCALDDTEETIPAVDKVITKLKDTIFKSCTNDDIVLLDGLCASSGSTPITVAEAQDCLEDMVREVATEEHGPSNHTYTVIGMLNATHPHSAAPYCGDGIVTATREEHYGVGEECDGDDTPCGSGSCYPPGDVFECTCDDTVRERFIVDGDADHTDSDAGWKGSSHDATHNDGFGYVTEFSNCDCSAFTQATCTGSSSDTVCDVSGNMAPKCSDDLFGTETCDERGNGNGLPEDKDCYRCDANSINAGDFCGTGSNASPTDETVCQSKCFDDETGDPVMPQTPCLRQSDCEKGQSCLGRCDNSATCNRMTEGSTLPQVSAEIGVCIMLEYKTDITGTKDIVSGATELEYTTRSIIRYGNTATVPCPVCAGLCVGGDDAGDYCYGRCNASAAPCLINEDCTAPGDSTCLETNDECAGGYCSLELRCWNGANAGGLCRLDYQSPLGPVSHDCLPDGGNVSGEGVLQDFGTVTTGAVSHPAGAACTNPVWRNYDCPCPADDDNGPCVSGTCQQFTSQTCATNANCVVAGVQTQPNSCAAACNAGPNVGKGCVTYNGGIGLYSTCQDGADAGLPCDTNSDCLDGGGTTCGGNPLQCAAGTVTLGSPCANNGDCGIGGLCQDACPGGLCVPLCMEEGVCDGGGRDGDPCSTDDHCKECTAGNVELIGTGCVSNSQCNSSVGSGDGVCANGPGFVDCVVSDPEDGLCAAGPVKYRCTGEGHTTEPCSLEYGTCSPVAICIAGTTNQGAACANNAFCGVGGVCSTRCTMGAASLRNTACAVNSDCIEDPNVPVSKGCEDGQDALPGTADDIVGAGVCEARPQDCFVNNGAATGGGTPDNPELNSAFCAPPNASSSTINDASGFGGPSRIRRTGSSFVNVPATP